jgi:hypothetical protein
MRFLLQRAMPVVSYGRLRIASSICFETWLISWRVFGRASRGSGNAAKKPSFLIGSVLLYISPLMVITAVAGHYRPFQLLQEPVMQRVADGLQRTRGYALSEFTASSELIIFPTPLAQDQVGLMVIHRDGPTAFDCARRHVFHISAVVSRWRASLIRSN